MHAIETRLAQYGTGEGRLKGRFTTADGYPPAGCEIKKLIFHNNADHFVHRHFLARNTQRLGWATFRAGTATDAGCGTVDLVQRVTIADGYHFVNPGRTDIDAPTAGNTLVGQTHDLKCGRNTFRIGTPFTAQRTSLKEDQRSHAGTIVHGILLDIENHAFCH
jgi:hypothetical protein